MVELKRTLGVRSFADIQVYRDGKLRCELKDCGNDLLDGWFNLWLGTWQNSVVNNGVLKLGEGGGPTSYAMTTLESAKLLTSSSYYGYNGDAATYSNETIDEGGNNYVIYTAARVFSYTVGGWTGTLRELGMHVDGWHVNSSGQTKTVQTRIVLPQELVITSDDQLVITYKFKVKMLNEITTEVVQAMYNKVPVDVTVTHTPGKFTDASKILDNYHNSSGYANSDYFFFSNIGVGAKNASLPMNSREITGVMRSHSVDAVNKTRTATITITADKANYAENEIAHLTFNSIDHPSKWSFDPPIPKTNRHIVKMSFVTKVERL
ncbi:tail fiber protein [Shewanella phage FishSpeaker]|nr:tail fiber protein [Shewanella phage FishSpeaker]